MGNLFSGSVYTYGQSKVTGMEANKINIFYLLFPNFRLWYKTVYI